MSDREAIFEQLDEAARRLNLVIESAMIGKVGQSDRDWFHNRITETVRQAKDVIADTTNQLVKLR